MDTTAQREESLKYLNDPGLWPMWPVLPVKRPVDSDLPITKCMGIVIVSQKYRYRIWFTNMFILQTGPLMEQLEGVEHIDFESFEEMVDSGWLVD